MLLTKRIGTAVNTLLRGNRRSDYYAITKSISIEAPYEQVFSFLINPMNWPRWAVVNVLSVAPGLEDGWRIETPFGVMDVWLKVHSASGVIDHDIKVGDTIWSIRARVVPNGKRSEFTLTFLKPSSFTPALFEHHLCDFDNELERLKRMMELKQRSQHPVSEGRSGRPRDAAQTSGAGEDA
jgi:hypothetical protein